MIRFVVAADAQHTPREIALCDACAGMMKSLHRIALTSGEKP